MSVLVLGAGQAGGVAAQRAADEGHRVLVASRGPRRQPEIEALGARFVPLSAEENPDYPAQLNPLPRQERPDLIIATARAHRQAAPKLLNQESFAAMKAGTRIEDLTASLGGNTPYTQLDQSVTVANGIHVRNRSNYPSQVPAEASRHHADCVLALFRWLAPVTSVRAAKRKLRDHPILGQTLRPHDPLLHRTQGQH